MLAVLVRREIPQPSKFFVDLFQIPSCYEEVNVFSKATKPILKKRHAARYGVWNPQAIKSLRNFLKSGKDRAFLFEVLASFAQSPPRVSRQTDLVGDGRFRPNRLSHSGEARGCLDSLEVIAG